MIISKKICFYALLAFTLNGAHGSCLATAADDADYLDYLDNPKLVEFAEKHDPTKVSFKGTSSKDIVSFIINAGGLSILQSDLYLHTYRLNKRPIIDAPIWLPNRTPFFDAIIGANLFYNQTSRMNLDSHSSSLCSYLAIQDKNLLFQTQQLQKILDPNAAPVDFLTLFKNMAIQDRQLGVMFQGQHDWKGMTFAVHVPLYYLERNFFVTEVEREIIEKTLGKQSQEETDKFASSHLISDKFGLGDTRATLDGIIFDRPSGQIRLGGQVTFATAFTVYEGLMGSAFENKFTRDVRPTIDIQELFDLATSTDSKEQKQARQKSEEFAFGAIDSLAALLLDEKLGHHHNGLGTYVEFSSCLGNWITRPWAQHINTLSRVSVEYLFPTTRPRFFVQTDNSAAFAALGLTRSNQEIIQNMTDDPEYADDVLAFLETQFVDLLYPFVLDAKIQPGAIVKWTSKFMYEKERWGLHLGTDFWFQGKEKLSDVSWSINSPSLPVNIDVEKARRPFAFSSKLFGSLFCNVKRPAYDWILSLNGDTTYWSSGVGKDFTLSLCLKCNF